MNTDTFLIIGGSYYINHIKENIPYLVSKFPSIGINLNAITHHTSHCAFLDTYLINFIKNMDKKTHIITTQNNCGIMDLFPNGDYLNLTGDNPTVPVNEKNRYAYFGFTHDVALAWCAKHNVKNVVLIGTADFDGDKYFHNEFRFVRSPRMEIKSINAINNMFSKYLKIYTVNPNSALDVDRISVDDIYKLNS